MNTMQKSKEYFAKVAADWDEIRSGYFTDEMRDAAITLADLAPDDIVVDMGTGTGFMIQGLAPRVTSVYGFDESPEMLVVARRNLAKYDNVDLREAQDGRLPLPDASVDAVFGNMYLHHTPEPATAIIEMARVLHPGGKLVLTDLDTHDQSWMREEMADRWLGFDRDDIRNWFSLAGLSDIRVDCAEGKCSTTSPQGKDLNLSIFVAFGIKI